MQLSYPSGFIRMRGLALLRVWHWLPPLAALLSQPELSLGQGTIVFHNTGGGQPIVSEVRSIFIDPTSSQPRLVFDFGFATDETPTPGTFLDSFTVTIQNMAQSLSAVYLTADATGVAWAPVTPGALFVDPASISANPIAYPNLQPVLGNRLAFEVTAPVPQQFVGQSVNVFFDLFDNLDPNNSQAWFSSLGLASVPEPQTWTLFPTGLALLWVFKRRSS